ncbi:MAG TPA: SDR family NAD(P)-dependent oxidoreductase [Dehalococcoidia bacterium]|nr:SDR family NAD(P)-dependent oxidoreductase [Dehalococcoidia bacterium]
MAGRLEGKVAIVTGASRGLGQYCAVAFALEGAKVAAVGRSQRETNLHLPGNVNLTAGMVEDYGGEAVPLICDVSDQEAVESMVSIVLERFGRIDVLMNNAAVGWDDPIVTVPPRLFEQELRTNVLGAFFCMRAVLPSMQLQGAGNIINVTAGSAEDHTHYGASKRALEVLTLGLADEVRGNGIAVNCLRPVGWVDTPGSLVRDLRPSDRAPPQSYLEAAILLAIQTSNSCTGSVKTDAEVVRDLGDLKLLNRFIALNPPYWGESLR